MDKVECKCKVCKTSFMARVTDRKRGWAKCCSKSCAASLNNIKTGNFKKYINSEKGEFDDFETPRFTGAQLYSNESWLSNKDEK